MSTIADNSKKQTSKTSEAGGCCGGNMSTIADSSKKQSSETSEAGGCCGGNDGDHAGHHAVTPASDDKAKAPQGTKSDSDHKGGSSGCGCGSGTHK